MTLRTSDPDEAVQVYNELVSAGIDASEIVKVAIRYYPKRVKHCPSYLHWIWGD